VYKKQEYFVYKYVECYNTNIMKEPTTSFGKKMKRLRSDAGLSQQEVAERLGMARATYASLEVDRRDPDLTELRSLAQFYEIPLANLVAPDENAYGMVHEPTVEYKTSEEPDVQHNLDRQLHHEKLGEVLLYVLEKVGAKPNVGESTLHKLLYFIDHDYQEKFGQSITGLTYAHNPYGPTPTRSFTDAVKRMEADGELEVIATKHFNNTQKKYLPVKKAELRELSARELEHINETLARLADMSVAELTELYKRR
jgi:transcriptional regulator with XRE-family HTH domain